MASRWLPRSKESQVDPFNAGEPELPWEDPASIAGNEGLFGEKDEPSYAAHGEGPLAGQPHKSDDNYQAPTTRGHDYDAPSIEDPAGEKPARSKRRRRGARSKAARSEMPPAPRVSAATRRARGCGTAALVIAVIIFVLTTIGVIVGIVEDSSGGLSSFVDVNANVSESYAEEADEREARSAFESRMDALLGDASVGGLHEEVLLALDERLRGSFGYSAEELGLDADELATWVCERTSYATDSVFAYSDGTATAYFELEAPRVGDIVYALWDETGSYLAEHGLTGSYDGSPAEALPNEEQRAHVVEALERVLGQAEVGDAFCSVELAREGGSWSVDEQSLAQALEIALFL